MKLPARVKYLCVEGVIGVGKTSFCKLLSETFSAQLVLEQFEDNPFLSSFYQNPQGFAFKTQLWFVVSRFQQLQQALPQQDLFQSIKISDYMFDKDRLFALQNLDEDEMSLYDTIAQNLSEKLVQPNYVVYLQASSDVLLQRISQRNRHMEKNITRSYIQKLNQAYDHFFFHYNKAPVLIVNTDHVDFVAHTQHYPDILKQVCEVKNTTRYYVPPADQLPD